MTRPAAGPGGERFFARADERPDAEFYASPRLVTHVDERAVRAVGELYAELGLEDAGRVLDLMGSWVSHFRRSPAELVVLGMNEVELRANEQAASWVVHDLNVDPRLPFDDASFDGATCCVSVDYLTDPVAVLRDLARVLRPGAVAALTFSNRCFPTKAVRGWLETSDEQHVELVAGFLRDAGGWDEPVTETRLKRSWLGGDPLWAVHTRRLRERVPASGSGHAKAPRTS